LAIPDAITHHKAFVALNSHLSREHATEVAKWELMVQAWEQDQEKKKPDPYQIPEESKSSSQPSNTYLS
jgi:hypothetical protein